MKYRQNRSNMDKKKRKYSDKETFIAESCIFDDEYMKLYFGNEVEITQLVLRIILDNDSLIVKKVDNQPELKNSIGQEITLDILATDKSCRLINIEIQRNNKGAKFERAMYHLSMINTNKLGKESSFEELPEVCVIFITENDVRHGKRPIYKYEMTDIDTGERALRKQKIIYVNGSYRDDGTALGRLIHDFKSKTVSGMYYKELADRARYLKETKEGKDKMGSVVDKIIKGHIDEWKDMGRAEGLVKGNNIARREIARELLKESKSYEKVASQVKLSIEEIKKIAEEMEKEDKQ